MTKNAEPVGHADEITGGGKWLERGILLAMLLACAVALSANEADPDLWGHVQYGRDALADRSLPETATYCFTAAGYRWINHENLSELLLAIGADTIGPIGLQLVKCLAGLIVVGVVMRHAFRQGVGLLAACLVSLLVAVNVANHWFMRPQLLSYTYYTLMIALLAWCFQGWEGQWRLWLPRAAAGQQPAALVYSTRRLRYLWLAPVLFVLWANSHGGFVAGLCIYIAYLSCRAVEALVCRGRAGWGLVARLALMIAAAALATLINPYGPGLHRWMLRALGTPRPEIVEWWPPDLTALTALPLWLIMITFVASLLLTRRSRDFTHVVLLGITLWQSLEHQRHIPFFAIMFGFWMPRHVQSLLQRFHLVHAESALSAGMSRSLRWAFAGGLCLAYILMIGRLYPRLSDMPVERERFPVSAIQYMADHQLQGKLVVTYNWAQYVIAAFGAKSPGEDGTTVSFDGRFRTCYPQEIVDMHFDFVLGDLGPAIRRRSPNSPPPDGHRTLEFGQPDLVLISRLQTNAPYVMNQHRDQWVLLYQDGLAQVWGRAAKYADPQSPQYVPTQQRLITDEPQIGSVTWPALPTRRGVRNELAFSPN